MDQRLWALDALDSSAHASEKRESRDFEIPQRHAFLTFAFNEHLIFHPALRDEGSGRKGLETGLKGGRQLVRVSQMVCDCLSPSSQPWDAPAWGSLPPLPQLPGGLGMRPPSLPPLQAPLALSPGPGTNTAEMNLTVLSGVSQAARRAPREARLSLPHRSGLLWAFLALWT